MPLYEFECQCGYKNDHIAGYDEKLKCPECKRNMKKLPSCGRFQGVPSHGYHDDTLGAFIDSNSQRRKLMKEQGVSEYNHINTRVSDWGRWV